MKFWTVKMIARAVARTPETVRDAMRKMEVQTLGGRGRGGLRVTDRDARRVIALQWPEVQLPEA